MYAQIVKSKENKSRAVANSAAQLKSRGKQTFGFLDNRSEAKAQKSFQMLINNRPEVLASNPVIRKQKLKPVVQRTLLEKDVTELNKWLEGEKINLEPGQLEKIIDEASNLNEARLMALDLAAQESSMKRKKLIDNIIKKFEKKKTEEELKILKIQAKELDMGGLGSALPDAIASLAKVLMAKFPPDKYSYVMMGNSPAPLMAWMKLNGFSDSFCHLPLGGFTAGNAPANDRKGYEKIWKSDDGQKIADYFNYALLDQVKKGKPLVLVDYVSTGGSMVFAVDLIRLWLKSIGSELQVLFFGYSEKDAESLIPLMKSGHDGVLATAVGEKEKTYVKMNADKLYKASMMLKGPASLDIAKLLKAENPIAAIEQQPAHYERLLRLMTNKFGLYL